MSRLDEFRKVLEEHKKDGISLPDIMAKMKATKSSAYSAISNLRMDKGYEVLQKNGRYFLGEKSATPSSKKKSTRSYVRHAPYQITNPIALPFALPKHYHRLPKDKHDQFIDMIGQAAFYYQCAEQLIKVEQLKATIII